MEDLGTPGQAPDLVIWGAEGDLDPSWWARVRAQCAFAQVYLAGPALPVASDDVQILSTATSSPVAAVLAAAGRDRRQPFLLLKAGTELPEHAVPRLVRTLEGAVVASALSNEHRDLTPLPIGARLADVDAQRLDALVFLHSFRSGFIHLRISSLCSLWRSEGLTLPEDCQDWSALERATARFGAARICDHLYVQDAGLPVAGPARPRQGRPIPTSSPLDAFRDGVWAGLEDALPPLPGPGLDQRPVQLHILHSWGGGVAKWVSEYAAARSDCHHLFLMTRGHPPHRQAGQAGQALSLHAGGIDTPAIRQWTLPRAVESCDRSNVDYRAVLDHVLAAYSVDQVIVSSLVGHSLDALRTGRPTLVVFHDYYPAWPILQVQFESEPGFDQEDLERAFERHARGLHFVDRTPADWMTLRADYLEALQNASHMRFAAPSHTVVNNLIRIDPRFAELDISVIPHGFDGFHGSNYRYQPPSGDLDRRLRLVVPGRMSAGKGKHLLTRALPTITAHADVYLVGAGKDGESFFGTSGVHVIPNYAPDELPALMASIEPDLALLLSTVSETFGYTLSEMRSLGIPVTATRLGALAERIEDGVSGWLIDPDPDALADWIKSLRDNPAQISQIDAKADGGQSVAEMITAYQALLPASEQPPCRYAWGKIEPDRLAALDAFQQRRLLEIQTQRDQALILKQIDELKSRASWAFSLGRQLDERTRWAKDLEANLASVEEERDESRAALDQLRNEFEDRTAWALKLDETVRQREASIGELNRAVDELAERLDQVVNSRSWQLTRPMRVAARGLRSLANRLGFQGRRAATLARRTHQSLRVRGVTGTVERIRAEWRRPQPESTAMHVPEVISEDEALAVPEADQPQVSIIIPVYNHYAHTHTCLKSIIDADTSVPFEVIVVDDASSDESGERLAAHSGIRVLRNEENRGFIGTCNRGAKIARGEYVLFLNNDTAVADGWLDALVATFGRHPDAGLVGAKLVYPDGRLQEAGGIVFSDGSGWNYGRFENPDHPAYNFCREVDYCSGACILLQRTLFDQLGGFDSHYAPAYYEDTDLAFKVRQAGLKVYYQPKAVVTHFEGVSSGTDLSTGTKRYQLVNQEKFLARWTSCLASHPEPGTSIQVARWHRRQKHALIIDATTPEPDKDSGSVRMMNLMSLLGELGYRVTFMADNRAWVEGYTEALQQRGVEVYYHPYVESPVDLLSEIGEHLDTVILSRHYIARNYIDLVRRHCAKARLLFDTVDLHYLREQRLAELEDDDKLRSLAEATRRDELEVARRCDTTLVVSPHEVEVLAEDAPDLIVKVLSNIHPVVGRRRDFSERKDLFFVGGYQHPPNIDAVIWFTREIFPLVRQELPDVQFHIVGSKAPPEVRRLEGDGVIYHGFVVDLEPFLDDMRLAMAPLRYGAGVKGKVNMSMSYGQPVIATPTAIEGMFASPGVDVLVGEDARSFADAVIRAYQDPNLWQILSDNALANVEQHFSFNAARRALEDILG